MLWLLFPGGPVALSLPVRAVQVRGGAGGAQLPEQMVLQLPPAVPLCPAEVMETGTLLLRLPRPPQPPRAAAMWPWPWPRQPACLRQESCDEASQLPLTESCWAPASCLVFACILSPLISPHSSPPLPAQGNMTSLVLLARFYLFWLHSGVVIFLWKREMICLIRRLCSF